MLSLRFSEREFRVKNFTVRTHSLLAVGTSVPLMPTPDQTYVDSVAKQAPEENLSVKNI